jgi:amino acid transporter/thiamine kinase-like enzyme
VGVQPAPPRELGLFASCALAMSTICVVAGGITSFPEGLCSVGGASVGLGWPLGCLFALAVALTMGQVVSAFPRAGGPSEWAAELGGRGWGWAAACFNLAALVTALAAVNVGLGRFAIRAAARIGGYDVRAVPDWVLWSLAIVATVSQAVVNHRGMRLTTRLIDFSGYLIIVVTAALTVLLLACAVLSPAGLDFSRLVAFSNYSGAAGGDVWPAANSLVWLFALGLMLPAYTMTAFDSAAQTVEETRDPETNVPRAIWRAVLISGLAGWLMLSAVVLAAPNLTTAAAAGDESFFWIIRTATPRWTHAVLYLGVGAAQYFCGLATVTAASRLTWALARDRGLPAARLLRRIGSHHTPTAAIWVVAIVGALLIRFLPYDPVASSCAVLFYIAYAVPTACGLLVPVSRWPRRPVWHLGRWYPPLAVVCVLGCVGLVILGMQPPNEVVAWVVGATAVGLFALWFGWFRDSFRDEVTRALRGLSRFRDRHEVTVTPLGGGLTNRNYRLEIDGEVYVLRIAGVGSEKLLIDRKRELLAAQAAHAAGVAPEVIDHSTDHTLLVTRFLWGEKLQEEHARQAEALRRVAAALRRFHDHPVPDALGAFSPFEAVRLYHAEARKHDVPLPEDLGPALELLERIEQELRADEPHCLCHNDLLLGNFIDEGHALRIIDWEYAGLGDRFFDLGNFAAHNQLGEAEERLLLEFYFGEARPEHLRRLRLMRLVSDLREATWGYLQSALSKLRSPQDYLDYGRRFLDRFLAAPEVKEWPGP